MGHTFYGFRESYFDFQIIQEDTVCIRLDYSKEILLRFVPLQMRIRNQKRMTVKKLANGSVRSGPTSRTKEHYSLKNRIDT
jgi:hypothetical protein